MHHWTVWVSALLGIFVAIAIYRFIVVVHKKPSIIGFLVASFVFYFCFWSIYYLTYGKFPDLTGLMQVIRGVWNEAVVIFTSLWSQAKSALG